MNLVVTKSHYDLVLGEKWLYEHRAKSDCHTNEVDFWHKNKAFRIHARNKQSTKQISVNAITRDLKSGSQIFAVLLRTTEKRCQRTEESINIKKLLDKYEDVFPDELPKGLPPERMKGDFHIELKPGSHPVKKRTIPYVS